MKKADIPSPAFSVLDLAVVKEGQTPAEAIQNSCEIAVEAEKCGYTRFWMAEHHNMEHIASSATAVLLGHVAEKTQAIRVGSGGVMLPNHSPLIIAEQFGTLASMYPNRIDLGLGRAPGTDQITAQAIRPDRMQQVRHFPENVKKLRRYLSADNKDSNVRAIPGEGTNVPLWILGSSTDSARVAAALGLPYVFASHFAPQQLLPALQIYRDNFQSSLQLNHPYVVVCVNVIAADTDEQAHYLSTSLKRMMAGIVTGDRKPLQPPVNSMNGVWNSREQTLTMQMLAHSLIGAPKTVHDNLGKLLNHTEADEIMAISHIFDKQAQIKSYRLFADVVRSLQPAPTTN